MNRDSIPGYIKNRLLFRYHIYRSLYFLEQGSVKGVKKEVVSHLIILIIRSNHQLITIFSSQMIAKKIIWIISAKLSNHQYSLRT